MPNSDSEESVLEHDGKTGADYSDADSGATKAIPPSERPDPTEEHESAGAFSEAMKGQQVEVRDPAEETDLDDWTPNQREQWDYMKRRERQYFEDLERFEKGEIEGTEVRKPLLGDLGGVGSGKSYTGAALMAPRQVQVYDGSIGLFCANTREQTERSLIPRFKKGMAALGYSWEKATYHKSIIFRGEVYKHTIAIEVAKNTYSFIRVGSFANADRLESEEFDWGVLSEIQSADEHDVKKVRRRIRGTAANALVYAEGTPRKQGHWQYDDNRGLESMGFKVWMSDTRDNPHKQPGYASELRSMYGAARADAMVAGHPIKESTDAVFYNFDRKKHAESEAAQELTDYEDNRRLVIFIDFNLSPMSIGVFQPKDASDYEGFKDEVLAQIDEFEVWQGGTRQAMREIRKKYGDHTGGAFISGDGTETKDTTSPDETDWDIVKSELADHLYGATVQPGTYQPEDSDKWSNPPVRDRINAGNWLLNDGLGRSRCVFLPESRYDSGGLMESVAQVEKDNEGKIEKSIDKTTDRDATQSHFADVWSYMAYDRMRKEGYIGSEKAVDEAMEQLAKMASGGGQGFGGGGERGSFTSF